MHIAFIGINLGKTSGMRDARPCSPGGNAFSQSLRYLFASLRHPRSEARPAIVNRLNRDAR
jgi:hypothetical protein